jgi:hypothetical protein
MTLASPLDDTNVMTVMKYRELQTASDDIQLLMWHTTAKFSPPHVLQLIDYACTDS